MRRSHTEKNGKDAGAERDVLSDNKTPMDRFKAIAKRLVRVSKAELQREENRYRERRKK
jgi:hypothetical protein